LKLKNVENKPKQLLLSDIISEKMDQRKLAKESREQRALARDKRKEKALLCTTTAMDLVECNFVDWSNHDEESVYFSFTDNMYITVDIMNNDSKNDIIDEIIIQKDECFRAVTENVPLNFTAALKDPVWGDAARKEFNTIMVETKAIVEIDQHIARQHINNGADVLRMIAVYEEKMKEGELVRKVRLVADGRNHHHHGPTYSPTPSREELLVLLHLFASKQYDFFHIDEQRAFLNARKQDHYKTFAKFSGDTKFYDIVGAVYGTKTASRDYQDLVASRMINLNFKRLHMCSCIYYKYNNIDKTVIFVYDYVDDFICGGNSTTATLNFINEFRTMVNTTEPELNPKLVLGMELDDYNEDNRTIAITMKKKN
jgi:hypothetical protein